VRNVIALFGFLLSIQLSAQDYRENVSIDIVNVYLTATDSNGRFVTDLKPEELLLKENGVAQTITNFTNFSDDPSNKFGEKNVPLTLAFVVDASTSMSDRISGQQKIDIVKNAAFRLSEELRNEDQVTLVTFNEFPNETTPLTSQLKQFERDLLFQEVKGGNTALLDSIYFAMEKIKDRWGRKIIVVCSDGEDTASKLKFDEVLSNLIASDVTVLAFGTMQLSSNSLRGRYILEKLAEASGGYAFFPTSLKKLDEVMHQLRNGMRSQYSLGYRAPHERMDGSWREIRIQCRRNGIKLRHREGYYAKPLTPEG
jgi:Ca-activated chloride channel family protein